MYNLSSGTLVCCKVCCKCAANECVCVYSLHLPKHRAHRRCSSLPLATSRPAVQLARRRSSSLPPYLAVLPLPEAVGSSALLVAASSPSHPIPGGSRRSGATHRCRPTNLPALRLGGATRRCRLTAPPYVSTCLMDALVALVWMVLWMVWVVMSAFS